jgi:uncharacterized protein YyaL (SSP411 family)
MQKIFFLILLSSILWAEHNYTNALIKETSPYLQQHAHNPVDWYPWSDEVFIKAKKENKLIFLSIGYSTCHWCHVMEEESFTNENIAKLLNDDFISIKVDREAYPQIDKKYQQQYLNIHGKRGGWPLSVFMSPLKEVFHLAAYIPKDDGYGVEGLVSILPRFVKVQKDSQSFSRLIQKYKEIKKQVSLKTNTEETLTQNVMKQLENQFDSANGGFAFRPKFPEASKLELLLDIYTLEGNTKALAMAEFSLTKMAKSGLYDHIGGGFFRYTIDSTWLSPHYEKMLYNNAELIAVYAKAYGVTADIHYKKIVEESIAQMEKNYMRDGLYLAASDADSDGKEGGYFSYAYNEVKSALKEKNWKPKEIEDALTYLGISEDGNVDAEFSLPHITRETVPVRVEELKAYLKLQRDIRTFPFVDTKIITAWNAMMIKALFVASSIDKKYLSLAQKRLEALLKSMRPADILYHQTLLGIPAKQEALLEDYAFLIDALIVGYTWSYEKRYLLLLQRFTQEALAKFYRDKHWYLSNDGLEVEADFDDRYYTSALSVMLENLLRLATLIDAPQYKQIVEETLRQSAAVLLKNPERASKLVHLYLRLKKEDIIIHARKEKLLSGQKQIRSIGYPFILSEIQESDAYLACKGTTCFAYDKNITRLIEKIKGSY